MHVAHGRHEQLRTTLGYSSNFSAAHREFCLTNQTYQQSGFHSANIMIEKGHGDTMQDNVDAIDKLAKATALERRTLATLTTTSAKLTSQLEAAQAYIKMIKD
jgi:ABC-type molybdenum transport system ATPase subunit/photorepair protein PhrA